MKHLFIILFFISFTCVSQVKYPLKKYPIHSSIWRAEVYHRDPNCVLLSPKEKTNFEFNDDYLKKIDISIIRTYLKSSFDMFRLSYGYKSKTENKSLSRTCNEIAKNILNNQNYLSDDLKKLTITSDIIPYFCFGNVDTKKIEINRVISDSFFDYCVGNDLSMQILLDTKNKEFGFGILYSEIINSFVIVIASKPKV